MARPEGPELRLVAVEIPPRSGRNAADAVCPDYSAWQLVVVDLVDIQPQIQVCWRVNIPTRVWCWRWRARGVRTPQNSFSG